MIADPRISLSPAMPGTANFRVLRRRSVAAQRPLQRIVGLARGIAVCRRFLRALVSRSISLQFRIDPFQDLWLSCADHGSVVL